MTRILLPSGIRLDSTGDASGHDGTGTDPHTAVWRDELGRDYVRHVATNGLARLGRTIAQTMGEALATGTHRLAGEIYEIERHDGATVVRRNGVELHGTVHPSRVSEQAFAAVALDIIRSARPEICIEL